MDSRLINVGFGNFVAAERILYVMTIESKSAKRTLADLRRHGGSLTDFTRGRKARSLIRLDNLEESGRDKIIASTLLPETIAKRIADKYSKKDA